MTRLIYCETGDARVLLGDLRRQEYAASDAEIISADNESDEMRLTIYPDNPAYHYPVVGISELVVEDDGVELWRGRVVASEPDKLTGIKDLTAKGPLDYLHDTLCQPKTLSGTAETVLGAILAAHNARPIAAAKKLYPGRCTMAVQIADEISSPRTHWEVLSSLLRTYGGHIRVRRDNGVHLVDWLAKFDEVCTQPVVLGSNLLSLASSVTVDELVTAMCGYGQKNNDIYLTIAEVNGGDLFLVDEDAVSAFGWIEGYISLPDITDAAALKSAVANALEEATQTAKCVSATAVDLADLGQRVEHINFGQRVPVRSRAHGIDEEMLVIGLRRRLFEPQRTEITLGASYAAASKIIAMEGKYDN